MRTTIIERAIKRKIREVLANYKTDGIYVYMPVPAGYGESSLDYLGFIYGHGFAIEAKRPGGKPTPRQESIIKRIEDSGAVVFVISDDEGLKTLDEWLFHIVSYEIKRKALSDGTAETLRLAR